MNFNSINTASIPNTLNNIEEGVGILLSTGMDPEIIDTYKTTLASIKEFIVNNTDEFFNSDLDPFALNDEAIRIGELIADLEVKEPNTFLNTVFNENAYSPIHSGSDRQYTPPSHSEEDKSFYDYDFQDFEETGIPSHLLDHQAPVAGSSSSAVLDDETLAVLAAIDDEPVNEPEAVDSETASAIAKLEEESAQKERHFLVKNQEYNYQETIRIDRNNQWFTSIHDEKNSKINDIIKELPVSDPKRFELIYMHFKEVRKLILANWEDGVRRRKDVVFTKENTLPLLTFIFKAYEQSYHALCEQFELEKPQYTKNDRLGKLEVMIGIGNLDDVNKAFDELDNEEQLELATRLRYSSVVFRALPGQKRDPFTAWEFRGVKYNPEATIAALNEMKPKSDFASYNLYKENSEKFVRKIHTMHVYLDPTYLQRAATARSSSQIDEGTVEAESVPQKSNVNLFALLNAIQEGNESTINTAFTQLDEEEKKSLIKELGFTIMMLKPPVPPFTKWRTRAASYSPEKTIDALNKLLGLSSSTDVPFEDDDTMPEPGFDKDGFPISVITEWDNDGFPV